MTMEDFSASWVVYYDAAECAYDIISGREWLRQDHENWLHQRMPTRLVLHLAESESAALEQLKNVPGRRQAELVSAW